MKKFTVLSREAARKYSYKIIEQKTIIISITDVGSMPNKFCNNPSIVAICRVSFNDVEKGQTNCITKEDAQQNQYQQYLPNNNQQQYGYQGNTTPVVEDPGKGKATGALVCGILALFFGWIPGVIALILASQYAKVGNGNSANNVKAGKIMAWIGIGFSILAVLICVIVFIGVLSAFSSTTGFIGLL